ncbi:Magnetosome protein MamH [Gammaproteobacteria bacterium]
MATGSSWKMCSLLWAGKREGCRSCSSPCGLNGNDIQPINTPRLQTHHHNALYLVVAVVMIVMTFIIALQPLYLSEILGLAYKNAGFVNSNIQVISEVLDLLLVGYLGYLSDRIGRVSLLVYGFLFTGVMALVSPFDKEIAAFLGLSALLVFYVTRVLMSLGTTLIWPQVVTLTGDYSSPSEPSKLVINVGFMMAFGVSLVYAVFMQIPNYIDLKYVMVLIAVIAFSGAWLSKNLLVEAGIPHAGEQESPLHIIVDLIKKEKRISLSLMAAFTSRNDMVVVGLFLMTWFIYFSDLVPGMTHVQAASQGGIVIGFMGAVVLLSIPLWGRAIESFGTVSVIAVALLLTGFGFSSLGLILNPLSWWILGPLAFVGVGQAGCLLASQILVLQQAPKEIRGTVLGIFNTVGCIGVIFFLQIGGFLFDWIGPTAPFTLVGIANLLTFGYSLWVMKNQKDSEQVRLQSEVFDEIEA